MDAAEARRILAAHGEDVSDRGRIGADAMIRAQHYADQDGGAGEPPADDYDQGVTAADFPPDDGPGPVIEAPPQRPKKAPRPKLAERIKKARARGQGRPRKPAKKFPRVPLDRFAGHVWDGLGRVVTPISLPAGRCMSYQSPFFGLVMEDTLRGTFIDRALQPVVRAEEKGRKIAAVVAPPVLCIARQAAMAYPEPQQSIRLALIDPLLLESLMLMDDVSMEYAEQAAIREQELGPKIDKARAIMEMMFAPPPGASAENMAAP